MNSKPWSIGSAAAGLLWLCQSAATTITIDNVNAAGVGFNDPTAAVPVGGNAGTTLGAQRLIVFEQAASQWAALLNSSVPIIVQAQMSALTCTSMSATLGSAGALLAAGGFSGARPNTFYNIAEANALAGADIDSGSSDDIQAQFNVTLDAGDPNCLGGAKWWYGIDPNVSAPANTIPLLPVVFHELGHGLGFTSGVSSSTGQFLVGPGLVSIWSHYLFDTQTNKLWKNMADAERLASLTNDPRLVWTGPRTNKQAHDFLKVNNALIINTPVPLSGPQQAGTATFGPAVAAAGVTGDLVYVDDGVVGAGMTPGTVHDGCETPFLASVSGKIAVIDRGYCAFTTKVKNAQTQGAIAAIIVNNSLDSLRLPLTMTGTDATITIPSYSVTQALGLLIEADLPAPGVNAKLGYFNLELEQGCVRMFGPNPALSGSSVSHFHVDALPNLLMEPALNTSIFNKVDLTLPLFADIDWSTNREDFIHLDGFDPNPCQHVQP